ncbi:uncharacterized protein LOC142768492 [Rhipicephalus microplus]|uniref:uncharacterized protein LOC142768492 n=1 Tax=Rhipicephalus microplus TaxID=6941 RepID=UPI003F6BDC1F
MTSNSVESQGHKSAATAVLSCGKETRGSNTDYIKTSGSANQDMAVVAAPMLLVGLLVSFFEGSSEARGWIEVRHPDEPFYRRLAEFTYLHKRPLNHEGVSYLVTQARWKRESKGIITYNIGFIVLQETVMHEKCIALVMANPYFLFGRVRTVRRLSCRQVAQR